MKVSKEAMKDMYLRMVRIREFESKAQSLFADGKIPGFVHLYLGEEAVATGVCACLRDDDYITSTHRGHGHIVAKGGNLKFMMAELFGKATGYCKGKGGSMHIADRDKGILGANGIVGAGHNIAVGAGLSASYRGTDQVCVCFFGDASTNQGSSAIWHTQSGKTNKRANVPCFEARVWMAPLKASAFVDKFIFCFYRWRSAFVGHQAVHREPEECVRYRDGIQL